MPGWAAGWLYNLDRAEVDVAARGCWFQDDDLEEGIYDGCGRGLEGLFRADGVTPQPLYYVYRAFGEMDGGNRLATESTAVRSVALATRHDAARQIRLLVGRYSCGRTGAWCGPARICPDPAQPEKYAMCQPEENPGPDIGVTVNIEDFPYDTDGLTVHFLRVPGENPVRPLPMDVILDEETGTLAPIIAGDTVSIPIESLQDGNALFLVVSAE